MFCSHNLAHYCSKLQNSAKCNVKSLSENVFMIYQCQINNRYEKNVTKQLLYLCDKYVTIINSFLSRFESILLNVLILFFSNQIIGNFNCKNDRLLCKLL